MEPTLINNEEFLIYSPKLAFKYWDCYYFSTVIPMNRIQDGQSNTITVNGRKSPFASVTVDVPSDINLHMKLESPVFTWRLNFPIYAINHTVIKIEHPDLFHPPIPFECWRYYERNITKTHYQKKEKNIRPKRKGKRTGTSEMGGKKIIRNNTNTVRKGLFDTV